MAKSKRKENLEQALSIFAPSVNVQKHLMYMEGSGSPLAIIPESRHQREVLNNIHHLNDRGISVTTRRHTCGHVGLYTLSADNKGKHNEFNSDTACLSCEPKS